MTSVEALKPSSNLTCPLVCIHYGSLPTHLIHVGQPSDPGARDDISVDVILVERVHTAGRCNTANSSEEDKEVGGDLSISCRWVNCR